jgi:hypothetical protein
VAAAHRQRNALIAVQNANSPVVAAREQEPASGQAEIRRSIRKAHPLTLPSTELIQSGCGREGSSSGAGMASTYSRVKPASCAQENQHAEASK